MRWIILLAVVLSMLISCIEDDIVQDEVDPVIRITSTVDTIALDSEFQFSSRYFDNVGMVQDVQSTWSSSNEEIISISPTGLALAEAIGSATITTEFISESGRVSDSKLVHVGQNTSEQENVIRGSIQSTSTYVLTGDFTFSKVNNGVSIEFAQNYRASSTLPGLYVYLTNNPSTIANALEIGRVTTFDGAHDYFIEDVGFEDFSHILYFCKPFNVKVGDGRIR